jgi:hypothetical protein
VPKCPDHLVLGGWEEARQYPVHGQLSSIPMSVPHMYSHIEISNAQAEKRFTLGLLVKPRPCVKGCINQAIVPRISLGGSTQMSTLTTVILPQTLTLHSPFAASSPKQYCTAQTLHWTRSPRSPCTCPRSASCVPRQRRQSAQPSCVWLPLCVEILGHPAQS